jgi:hypothetical protein
MGALCLYNAPAALPTSKEIRYPFYWRLGGSQDRAERVEKISPPPRFDLRTVYPIASRYADYNISAHIPTCGEGIMS